MTLIASFSSSKRPHPNPALYESVSRIKCLQSSGYARIGDSFKQVNNLFMITWCSVLFSLTPFPDFCFLKVKKKCSDQLISIWC